MASFDNEYLYASLLGKIYRLSQKLNGVSSMVEYDLPSRAQDSFESRNILLPGEDEGKFRDVCYLEEIDGINYGKPSVRFHAIVAAEELGNLITAVNMLPHEYRNAIDDAVTRAGKAYDDFNRSVTTNA